MWRHRTPIWAVVTRGRTVLVESFVTSLTLNISPSRLVVLCVVLNCLSIAHNGLQHAINVIFVDVFPVIKREKPNVLTFFSNHYDYAFWMKWKLIIQFLSVHSIRRTCSLNALQMTTLTVKQFKSSDVANHTRMIYKPIQIKNMFGYLF